MLSLAIPHLTNPDWHYRRAALMFIGNSTEGCVLPYREKFAEILPLVLALAMVRPILSAFVACLNACDHVRLSALRYQDPHPTVREGVALCLAQFCDHMPQSSLQHHASILPVVFHFLDDPDTYVKEKRCGPHCSFPPRASRL